MARSIIEPPGDETAVVLDDRPSRGSRTQCSARGVQSMTASPSPSTVGRVPARWEHEHHVAEHTEYCDTFASQKGRFYYYNAKDRGGSSQITSAGNRHTAGAEPHSAGARQGQPRRGSHRAIRLTTAKGSRSGLIASSLTIRGSEKPPLIAPLESRGATCWAVHKVEDSHADLV